MWLTSTVPCKVLRVEFCRLVRVWLSAFASEWHEKAIKERRKGPLEASGDGGTTVKG